MRFRFAKDSGCYVNILRYLLTQNNKSQLVNNIPEINLWLEFGVSQTTQLSLLSIGLTRNSAIELSQYITNTHLTKQECLEWLDKNNYENIELSPIIIDDIKKAIGNLEQ